MDDRFQQVEALMMNSKAASSWHDIVPIRVLNSLAVPPNFPNKLVKFWRLQRPRNQHHLVELLRFYDIRASDLTTPMTRTRKSLIIFRNPNLLLKKRLEQTYLLLYPAYQHGLGSTTAV